MQYRISTSIASICRNLTVEKAMGMVGEAGFEAVDFPFSVYSTGENAPMKREAWHSWVREVAELSRTLGLPITQAHATWEQGIPADFRYEPPHEIYYRTMEACRMVGCRHLIFHPVRQLERVDSLSMRRRIHDWNVRWFHDLVGAAEQFNVIINLENTFDSHHVQKPGDPPYPYTTTRDMLELLHDIGSARVQLCLDTGHANISAQDIPAMIRAYRGELATVHLNDNYGRIGPVYEDLHLFPGYGRIEWREVFRALREIRFSGVMNIEPIGELKHISDPVRKIQLRAAADILQTMLGDTDCF